MCDTLNEEKCETINEEKCDTVTDEVCETETEQKCETIQVSFCYIYFISPVIQSTVLNLGIYVKYLIFETKHTQMLNIFTRFSITLACNLPLYFLL